MASKPKPETSVVPAQTLMDVALEHRYLADALEQLEAAEDREALIKQEAQTVFAGKEKVDRFGGLCKRVVSEIAFCKAEEEVQYNRRKSLESLLERLKILAMEAMRAADETRLEGHRRVLRLQPTGKPSVKILDEAKIPSFGKTLTIRINAANWEAIVEAAFPDLNSEERAEQLATLVKSCSAEVAKTEVLEAITRGEEVPGADVDLGAVSFRVD